MKKYCVVRGGEFFPTACGGWPQRNALLEAACDWKDGRQRKYGVPDQSLQKANTLHAGRRKRRGFLRRRDRASLPLRNRERQDVRAKRLRLPRGRQGSLCT